MDASIESLREVGTTERPTVVPIARGKDQAPMPPTVCRPMLGAEERHADSLVLSGQRFRTGSGPAARAISPEPEGADRSQDTRPPRGRRLDGRRGGVGARCERAGRWTGEASALAN